jgi:Domain of unknown function (DUF4411)
LLYLLDADTLITGDRKAYPLRRFPIFWEWLRYQGAAGNVKVPVEQFEEVTSGRGDLVDWLLVEETKNALLFDQDADPALVAEVTLHGYGNLDEDEIELVGRDPFLISYAVAARGNRTVVSFEVSAPGRQRARRKIPDVCRTLGVPCCTLFEMIDALDFTTDWRP